ncbi:exocyst complex component 3-like protein [Microcaecilia unicolor]|uniref:Exocyst complex component 3-like protein n=1 Tax=Microcaecilia unicolor TaxID=1415580 RepID=A0A6P7Y933_9AMPH|nr:exocyst complex component 3-like protein [Microcaecilia unicolor]
MSAVEDFGGSKKDEKWPELEKAEKLARGAALKWASGIFYRPDQLEGLGYYRKREAQRNNSIQSRLKSVVQSYLEGVSIGLGQLRCALDDVRGIRHALGEVQEEWRDKGDSFQGLKQLRDVVTEHVQLTAVVHNLPHVFSVPEIVSQTHGLIDSRQLLEAHAKLMELECWRDNILYQLHRGNGSLSPEDADTVLSYFSGVQKLSDALARELWDVVGCGLTFVRKDPALFVSAVRIIEREERIDSTMLEGSSQHRFLPPGRPKDWRQRFFQVIQEAISAQFRATQMDIKGPGLANHLAALQNNIMDELNVVKHLMVQCCPPHYDIFHAFVAMYHQSISGHLQDIISWDLTKNEMFTVLNWTLCVYRSAEMMGHPDLCPDVDITSLGPLLAPEVIEQLQRKYVSKVKANMIEWMQKALETEFSDWHHDQEPEMDHEGFYHSTLPVIIMQILDENIQVASLIGDSLQHKVISMAVHEFDCFLCRLRETLVEYGKEHLRNRSVPKFYIPYLLATINNCIALSSSISYLKQERAVSSPFEKLLPSLHAALDKTQKKACRLLIDELLLELQPLFLQLPSHSWLMNSQFVDCVCQLMDHYYIYFSRARNPMFKFLLLESERVVIIEYVRALMQKRLLCRNTEERLQFSDRMSEDALELTQLFLKMGLDETEQSVGVILALQELIRLKDPSLLTLEVSGFVTKYPDISDEHISVLLEIRGDVSKEIHNLILEMMQQNTSSLPENYHSVFTNILVPARVLPFCLRTGKCA